MRLSVKPNPANRTKERFVPSFLRPSVLQFFGFSVFLWTVVGGPWTASAAEPVEFVSKIDSPCGAGGDYTSPVTWDANNACDLTDQQMRLEGGAQRVQGGQPAGFSSAQQTGTHVGAHENGSFWSHAQCSGQDNRVSGSEVKRQNQFIRVEDVATLHLKHGEGSAVAVGIQTGNGQAGVAHRNLTTSHVSVQRSCRLCDRQRRDQQRVGLLLEQAIENFGTSLGTIAFDQSTGIEEVEHGGLTFLVAHIGDGLRQAPFDVGKAPAHGLQRDRLLRQPFLGDRVAASNHRIAHLLQLFDRDVMMTDVSHTRHLPLRSLA